MRALILLILIAPLFLSGCSAGSIGSVRWHDDVCVEC